jgi:hypothetical protein
MDIIGDADEFDPSRPVRERPGRRVFIQPPDLAQVLLNGLIPLAAAIVAALLGLLIVIYGGGEHVDGGPGDFFALAVWLTGASLGVPVKQASSTVMPGQHGVLTDNTEVRVVVWLLTAIVLVLVFRLVRRQGRARTDATPARLAVWAVLSALTLTVALLVLSLATTRASVFGLPIVLSGDTGASTRSSVGPELGFVFAGPLLLTAIAALAGAATATRLGPRASAEIARWRPVLDVAWRQVAVTGELAGFTLLVYLAVEVSSHTTGREAAVTVFGLILLLPNLAIYGTLGGFGTTFYGSERFSPDVGPGKVAGNIGILGSFRPWVVWLLVAAAVVGVLVSALLARRSVRVGRLASADYSPVKVWRATAGGLVVACAVVLLGALTYSGSSGGAGSSSLRFAATAGPSLLAAAGLTALWLSAGYLVASLAVRGNHRPEELPQPSVGQSQPS